MVYNSPNSIKTFPSCPTKLDRQYPQLSLLLVIDKIKCLNIYCYQKLANAILTSSSE